MRKIDNNSEKEKKYTARRTIDYVVGTEPNCLKPGGTLYTQDTRTAMRSPISSIVTNVFLKHKQKEYI
jgi:hypothetical protein